MASTVSQKVSFFPETTYGTANVSAGGRAYKTKEDGGWTYITEPVVADGFYEGRQAALSEDSEQVIKGYEGSYSKALRTHGEELFFLDAVGVHNAAPAVVAPATTPPTYTKTYETAADGPEGSYTIVVDRAQERVAAATNYRRDVYAGAMVKSWGLTASVGSDPVMVNADYVAQSKTSTDEASPITSSYAAATVLTPRAFGWQNCEIKVGAEGVVGASIMNYVSSFSYTQDNTLKADRWYLKGSAEMEQPKHVDAYKGTIALELHFSDEGETALRDRFEKDQKISIEFTAKRESAANQNEYTAVLWLPSVLITNAAPTASLTDLTTLSVAGELKWQPSATVPAARLTLTTEGTTNP